MLTPYWLSGSRVFCGSRLLRCRRVVTFVRPGFFHEGQWHQVEDHAQMPDTPAKFDRYVERAVFQFHPVRDQLRPAAVSEASVPLPSPPLGQHFVCALPARWRSVVAALARAIHGGYQGYLFVFSTVDLFSSNSVCRWEHMAQKRRELQGHDEAIVQHLVEFQANDRSGRAHGQRFIVPGPGGAIAVKHSLIKCILMMITCASCR